MYFTKATSLYLAIITTCILSVASQNAPDEVQVDPNAQCSQEIRDQITSCLDQVEKDESKLSTGPCTSTDWKCICTKQQGMVDCYSECPGLQPVDMINFNGDNCKGQHGETIKVEGGDLTYTWSAIPFTSTSTEPPTVNSSGGDVATSANTSSTSVATILAPSSTPAANASTSTSTDSTKSGTASSNNSTAVSASSKNGAAITLTINEKLAVVFVTVAISLLALPVF